MAAADAGACNTATLRRGHSRERVRGLAVHGGRGAAEGRDDYGVLRALRVATGTRGGLPSGKPCRERAAAAARRGTDVEAGSCAGAVSSSSSSSSSSSPVRYARALRSVGVATDAAAVGTPRRWGRAPSPGCGLCTASTSIPISISISVSLSLSIRRRTGVESMPSIAYASSDLPERRGGRYAALVRAAAAAEPRPHPREASTSSDNSRVVFT